MMGHIDFENPECAHVDWKLCGDGRRQLCDHWQHDGQWLTIVRSRALDP